MTRWLRAALVAAVLLPVSTLLASAPPGIELVGIGYVPGNSHDNSGLIGEICSAATPGTCIPKDTLGGFGSAMTYTGHDNVFVAAPDRGPFDGLTDVPYLNRVQFFHIATNTQTKAITATLLDTRFLKNEFGQTFVGAAGAFDTQNPLATLRLDPEGIRVGSNGNMYISDEYGPYLFEFDRQGNLVQRINVPSKFLIANPSADPNAELLGNTAGRQANRGMEGLAISPDGFTLFGMMQNALLQDGGILGAAAVPPTTLPTDRLGVNNRILKVDLITGETHEYVYRVEAINRGQGVSEILAINDHQFLVVERDNRSWLSATPQAPTRKWIYKIDITGATDVSNRVLPAGALPAGVVPVQKSLFIDLLDPDFGLQNNDAKAIAEKIEGLAWGPDLPDGRHVLYVVSDNDLITANPTQIYAFAIDNTKLTTPLDFQAQVLPGPFFPPGQVKKIIGK